MRLFIGDEKTSVSDYALGDELGNLLNVGSVERADCERQYWRQRRSGVRKGRSHNDSRGHSGFWQLVVKLCNGHARKPTSAES